MPRLNLRKNKIVDKIQEAYKIMAYFEISINNWLFLLVNNEDNNITIDSIKNEIIREKPLYKLLLSNKPCTNTSINPYKNPIIKGSNIKL